MSAVAPPTAATYGDLTSITPFSVTRYLQMVEKGILTPADRVELLENFVIYKVPGSPLHDGTLDFITDVMRTLLSTGWRCRSQSALVLPDSVPEPDICVARGDVRTYLTRHPTPADVALVVEVADSSLLRDQRDKTRIYARAGLPLYWIVNLLDRRVEVYANPTGPTAVPQYQSFATCQPGDHIPLHLDAAIVSVPVADLLP